MGAVHPEAPLIKTDWVNVEASPSHQEPLGQPCRAGIVRVNAFTTTILTDTELRENHWYGMAASDR